MADRVLFISWGDTIPGREEYALEVFTEAIAICGRMREEGRIERLDVVILEPNGDLGGYMELHGSSEQLDAVREDEEFRRNSADATLVVRSLRHVLGVTDERVAREMAIYTGSIAKAPQRV